MEHQIKAYNDAKGLLNKIGIEYEKLNQGEADKLTEKVLTRISVREYLRICFLINYYEAKQFENDMLENRATGN